jgi:RNA polymerase sigma factor (sigma-70 family)
MPPFEEFYTVVSPRVWRALVKLVGRPAAEDCFQETFLAALRAYPDLKSADNLEGWALTIARRKAVDHWRREAKRPLPTATLEEEAVEPLLELPENAGVWETVESLPPRQRVAVTLRYEGDLSHAEIAAVMGSSVEAARQNLYQALSRLRRIHTNHAHA